MTVQNLGRHWWLQVGRERWVLRADGSGQDYGLGLPAQTIAPGHGPSHRQQCLEALALC